MFRKPSEFAFEFILSEFKGAIQIRPWLLLLVDEDEAFEAYLTFL